ncbi:putative resistance transmembrane protein [Pandoraea communis]|uniref:Putative resistance transmembrane protein n=1 Tax=Pandoraea communis TaxID=2508297 RepID=A0A5E4WQS4_9BURK|nr:MdtA/MuxA family multidrug efflux RND transporter periplasmic adaptor subunit [Pandoraea communis]VVE26851.1 putative resistance transmembrane protein [Pandoraea communis]
MTEHGPHGSEQPNGSDRPTSPTSGAQRNAEAAYTPSRTRRWLVPGVIALFVVLIAGGVYYRLHSQSAQKPAQAGGRAGMAGAGAPATPVTAVEATTGDLPVFLNGLGTVTPTRSVTVHSRVDGQLMKVHFKEGDMVKEGQVLAEIDPRPFQVQVTQMEGQLARDQALLKNAQLDLARYETLLKQDSIAGQTVDTQRALVKQYEGTVKADEGLLGNARLQLNYASVSAPVSGLAGLRQVDPGNIVHASDTNGIVIINEVTPITVVYTIPEDSLPKVVKRSRGGETLLVETFDRSGKIKLASGKLASIDNQIDTTTGTVKLKAEFANGDGLLFPNQFVNVKMLVDTLKGATLIPSAAVQRGTQGSFVYTVQPDQTVKLKTVKLGPTDGTHVAVESGIVPGEKLVIDGMDKLRDGAKVEVITAASRAAAVAPRAPDEKRNGSGGHRRPAQ